MKVSLVKGATSVILTVFIMDSSSSTGAGLGSLIHTSSIVGGYVRAGATGVALTVDEDVSTEGTYQAPSSAAKMRIGTPANMTSGTYELHLHNDLLATGADILTITLGGATNMAPLIIEVQLTSFDLNTSTVDVGKWIGTAVTLGNGAPDINIQSTDDVALSSQQKLDVNTEADAAIVTYRLDHLVAVADSDDVVDDSIMAKIADDSNTANWSAFNNKKESLAALRKRGDNAWATGITGTTLVLDTSVSTVNSQTDFDLADSTGSDGALDDMLVVFYDANDGDVASIRVVSASLNASNNIVIDEAADFTVATSDACQIFAVVPQDGPIQGDPWAEFPGRLVKAPVTGASTTTSLVVASTDLPSGAANDDYNDAILIIRDASTGNRVNIRKVTDFIAATPAFVVDTLGFTPAAGDQIEVWISATAAGSSVPELGGFGTTAPTRVFDYIVAMMSDGATDPVTGIADYDPSLHSLEALKTKLNLANSPLLDGTSTASSTTSKIFIQTGDPPSGGADDDYNGSTLIIWSTGTKSTAQVAVRIIDDYDDSDPSFTVSPVLPFTPASGALFEVWAATTGDSFVGLTSGFGSTSPDRLIDHLRSTMSKNAVTPSGLGTYAASADSQEAQAERQALIEGSGFSTSTDSLKEIRDAIDTLIAPAIVSASSLSGSGFLSDVVSLVRKATDEPNNSPKYTDGDIVELLQAGMDSVLTDILINTDHPIIVRYNITLVDGTQYYILPPNVAELMRVAKVNSTSSLAEYEVWPGSHMSPGGSGWKLEGNVLRFLRNWSSTDTLELMYIPNSEPLMHKATASSVTSTGLVFPSSVTDGTLGTRPNEYVGMLCRIISSDTNLQEERLITAYDVVTRAATIAKAWDTTPTGTVVYEVVPIYSRTIKHVVALRTAIDLLAQEGNSQRMATLNQNYAIKLSAMRRQLQKMEGRFPHHFDGDTWDNSMRGSF